jgi:hypothetical protein
MSGSAKPSAAAMRPTGQRPDMTAGGEAASERVQSAPTTETVAARPSGNGARTPGPSRPEMRPPTKPSQQRDEQGDDATAGES